jgi:signal transduction histidine kinase
MIKTMRHKFIAIATGAMLILLIVIFATINIYMKQLTLSQADDFLQNVLEHDGEVEKATPQIKLTDTLPMVDGFSFLVSSDGEIQKFIHRDGGISNKNVEQLLSKIEIPSYLKGDVENYRYSIKVTNDGYLVVMVDTSLQNSMLEKLVKISCVTGIASFGIIFILIIILSKYVTKPVEVAFDKQKRFIADSSHELKTPLSIIAVNLDMLEMEIGKSSRTIAISEGIKRMSKLIHELLLLARTEQKNRDFISFNLSEVMESTILPLEVVAYEEGNEIETRIEENIMFKGDEEGFRKMIAALMENAIKYSRKDSVIKASLYTKGDYKIIEIFNEGIGVTKEQKEKLFDKFYRVDDSRQRETGGYGIGLSIVKSIVDMHKGKIYVESVPNEHIVFKITLQG